MYQIFEFQFKLKPNVCENEMLNLFNEAALPILRKIPGLISVYVIKYTATGLSGGTPEWDYVWIEVWESDEAHRKAWSDKYMGEDSQLAQTGFYEAFESIEKAQSSLGTLIASSGAE